MAPTSAPMLQMVAIPGREEGGEGVTMTQEGESEKEEEEDIGGERGGRTEVEEERRQGEGRKVEGGKEGRGKGRRKGDREEEGGRGEGRGEGGRWDGREGGREVEIRLYTTL